MRRSAVVRAAALALLLASALTLAACGRKGPLEAPPAALGGPTAPDPVEYDAEGRPLAPAGEKKRLPIDFLLD